MKNKMKLVMDKFPFLKHTQDKIQKRQKVIDINKKLILEIPSQIEKSVDSFAKLKLEKEFIQLELEQAKNYKQLSDDEMFFKTFREKMKSGIEKVNLHYDDVVKEARKHILSDQKFAEKFKQFEQFDFENNWEAKVSFFLELEVLLSEAKTISIDRKTKK
jgi:nucleoside diphosphate kinase